MNNNLLVGELFEKLFASDRIAQLLVTIGELGKTGILDGPLLDVDGHEGPGSRLNCLQIRWSAAHPVVY